MVDWPEVIEIWPSQPSYCDGLASVDIGSGGNVRISFFTEERDTDGRMNKILSLKLIIPQAALMEAVSQILAATGHDDKPLPHAWPLNAVGGHA